MNKNYHFCLSALCLLTAFLLIFSGLRQKEQALSERLSQKILRFHVLANSDSPEDQAVKLQVRDGLLKQIQDDVSKSASKDELLQYLSDKETELENLADEILRKEGVSYRADLCLETCSFPRRTYGDLTFPAGTYEAVRVLLGDGNGKNFWCVLYPSLCYSDSVRAVMPEDSREVLKSLIPEEDFSALLAARRSPWDRKIGQNRVLPEIKLRFRLPELLSLNREGGNTGNAPDLLLSSGS